MVCAWPCVCFTKSMNWPKVLKLPTENFGNGVAHAVARVAAPVAVASVRGLGHPDAQKSRRNGSGRQSLHLVAPISCRHFTLRELHPRPGERFTERIFLACPILNHVLACVRIGPGNLYRINLLGQREIHYHPLRIRGIRIPREFRRQIGIALPVRRRISVGHSGTFELSRVAARRAAMSKPITKRLAQKILGLCASYEISTLVLFVAPCSVRIPMPRVIR